MYLSAISVVLSDGSGGYSNPVSTVIDAGTIDYFGTGDINNDGADDLILNDDSNGETIFLLNRTTAGTSHISDFTLKTVVGARQALQLFDRKIQTLSKQRGQIGAFQSRVQVGINNLQSASENYAAAESRIKDADIAAESAQLVRLNILQQAASSVLGQANLQPELALRLLRN